MAFRKHSPRNPRSCHNVFDHRTKGVCLEGLSGVRTKSAPMLLLHAYMHGAECTVPGERQARQRLAEVLGVRLHAA
jgi:hypothetical protein